MSQMIEKRPSRVAVAYIYAKRAIRWRRNSYPYISGDAFADLADYVYEPPRWRNFNKVPLESAKIIFVRSENVQDLFTEYGHVIRAAVIITGNSDYEIHSPLKNIPTSVKAIFIQNSFISDGVRIFSIPLGIENFRWGVNGNPRFMRELKSITPSERRVLFGPLGKTHRTREIVTRDFDGNSEHWDFFRGRIKPQHFDKLAKGYTHVAAVRGNGIDTHRLWESLYRGITPIVEKSTWWDSLSGIFPEVEIVDSWTHENVLEVLARSNPSKSFRKNPALWMPFWENEINRFLD
jgi:hypothetical protein